MKFPTLIVFALLLQCQSTYWQNRGRDAMDILTVEGSTGNYGAALRLGPLKFGAHYKSPGVAYGLRGGSLDSYYTAEFAALFMGADYYSSAPPSDLLPAEKKDKDQAATATGILSGPVKEAPPVSDALTARRGKEFRARSPFGTSIPLQKSRRLLYNRKELAPLYYYTQLEITLGLYAGLKIGLNLGELLDFLLGFVGIDIMADDAPYLSRRIRELKKSPLYQNLSPEEKALLEQAL
ncbi:MAG: hypothetical protein HS115_07975 [Spirochaetales bacterium]|nr:hypothetical protein [Spirochaetales bacterium]